MRSGIPFVISAPSGVGKSTLIRELRSRLPDLGFSVSHTTRLPRDGEQAGADYHFVDRSTFERMIETGEFVEWAPVHLDLYGTSLAAVEEQLRGGRDVILDIDVQGALQVADRMPGAVLTFVLPPSWEELRRRLETRALDAPEAIAQRLENARGEVNRAACYHYLVVNRDLGRAVDDLVAIVHAERCRTCRGRAGLDLLLTSSADPTREASRSGHPASDP
jgi:guanylate kinase